MSNKKLNKEIISIDHDDDQENYEAFSQFLDDHTKRVKKREADVITTMGESLLNEIDHKNSIKDVTKKEQIDYIIKKSSKYSEEYLLELDYRDVTDIFNEIKYENRSFWTKFLEFFNQSRH